MISRGLLSIIFLLFIYLATQGFHQLKDRYSQHKESASLTYLPNEDAVNLVSLGYKIPTANFLWFHTINYFGKHYRGDKNYQFLNHMCKLVSKLNPKEKLIYEFCALILSYEANLPRQAVDLLDFAVKNNPDYWRYYYLRGMIYMIFKRDSVKAQSEFAEGGKKKGAPAFLITMAARKITDFDKPETAIEFLDDAIQNAQDETQRKALIERRVGVINSINKTYLQRLVDEYKEKNKALPDSLKIFSNRLETPYGGIYYLNKETGKVENSIKK